MFSLIIVTLLLVFTANAVLAGGVIKVGADVGGELGVTVKQEGFLPVSLKNDTEMGFSVGGEIYYDLNESLAVGAGAEYQLKRKEKGGVDGFNFIPIYALGRFQIDPNFYVTGKVGYNLYMQENLPEQLKAKGGLFFGFGGGAVFNDMLQLEVLYSIHNGKWELKEDPGVDYDLSWKYTKIGISAGFLF
jgi:hypothetical protein